MPSAVLLVECAAAWRAKRAAPAAPSGIRPPKIAILIPAHNEELLIDSTISSIRPQLGSSDRLIVVADNCDDRTANIARAAGAEVTERRDPVHRGKGYALSHGVDHLRHAPPDVLLIFDADCAIDQGVVALLAGEAWASERPIQATYLLESPDSARARGAVSSLAFLVKNAVRPAGLAALGLPCLLTGTGMAFPWSLIAAVPLASGHLVEDMQLGLDLLKNGHAPKLCQAVTIRGRMPDDRQAAYIQRTRWEHGHLAVLCSLAMPLLLQGISSARIELIVMALDLTVPPLALLCGVWTAGAMASLLLGLTLSAWGGAFVFGASGIMIAAAVAMAWMRHARHIPLRALLAVPGYLLWKLPLYVRFLFSRQTSWIRTSRNSPAQN